MSRTRGFSLVELVVVMAALGGAALAVALPALNAARGIDTAAATSRLRLALEEEAARAETDFRALPTGGGRSGALLPLVASSPYTPHGPSVVDGITRSYRREVVCVDESLAVTDPTCALGYALVTIFVNDSRGDGGNLTFVATPEGP